MHAPHAEDRPMFKACETEHVERLPVIDILGQ
jgi:hypothetical protein